MGYVYNLRNESNYDIFPRRPYHPYHTPKLRVSPTDSKNEQKDDFGIFRSLYNNVKEPYTQTLLGDF